MLISIHDAISFLHQPEVEGVAFLKEKELWTDELTALYDTSYNLTLLS